MKFLMILIVSMLVFSGCGNKSEDKKSEGPLRTQGLTKTQKKQLKALGEATKKSVRLAFKNRLIKDSNPVAKDELDLAKYSEVCDIVMETPDPMDFMAPQKERTKISGTKCPIYSHSLLETKDEVTTELNAFELLDKDHFSLYDVTKMELKSETVSSFPTPEQPQTKKTKKVEGYIFSQLQGRIDRTQNSEEETETIFTEDSIGSETKYKHEVVYVIENFKETITAVAEGTQKIDGETVELIDAIQTINDEEVTAEEWSEFTQIKLLEPNL